MNRQRQERDKELPALHVCPSLQEPALALHHLALCCICSVYFAVMGSEMGSYCVWKTALPLICSSGAEQLALCALKTKQRGKMKKAFQALSPPRQEA